MTSPDQAKPSIDDVRAFWNSNPLWTGEAQAEPGSAEFFRTHNEASLAMTGGVAPEGNFPNIPVDQPLLDLGCGIGFWVEQFWSRGYRNITGADLSSQSLALAQKRCDLLGATVTLDVQNAEAMTYPDNTFAHVNCIGVIHHSPSPEKSVAEIARVLRPGGTATISVYYWNVALRAWPLVRTLARTAASVGITLKGRGRESMMDVTSARELIRLYDGDENPIGYSYSKPEFRDMLAPHFDVTRLYGHVFPARILPFQIPRPVFRLAEMACPFMICANVVKRPA